MSTESFEAKIARERLEQQEAAKKQAYVKSLIQKARVGAVPTNPKERAKASATWKELMGHPKNTKKSSSSDPVTLGSLQFYVWKKGKIGKIAIAFVTPWSESS